MTVQLCFSYQAGYSRQEKESISGDADDKVIREPLLDQS